MTTDTVSDVVEGALVTLKRGTTVKLRAKAESADRPAGSRELTLYAVFDNQPNGVHMELPFNDRMPEQLAPVHELDLEAIGFWKIAGSSEVLVNQLLQKHAVITIKEVCEQFAVLLDIPLTTADGVSIEFNTELFVPQPIAASYLEFVNPE